MRQFIGCSSAKDAGAKVILYNADGSKNVMYYGDPNDAEDMFLFWNSSYPKMTGKLKSVDWKVKEGNSWV